MRIVVVLLLVGLGLFNYLRRCSVLVPWMSFFSLLLLFFVVGQLKFLALPLITYCPMGYHYNLAQLIFAAGH